jgi:hypothetical protein
MVSSPKESAQSKEQQPKQKNDSRSLLFQSLEVWIIGYLAQYCKAG